MRKKLISILITLCVLLTLLPTTVFAASSLYKVKVEHGAPFRATEDGSIVSKIGWDTVVEALDTQQGDYIKVKWNGYPVYVWADKLNAVNAPDAVCSEWSREWITGIEGEYVGLKSQYPTVENDYTKPITRIEMTDIMMNFLAIRSGKETRRSDYHVVLKGVEQPLTDTDDRTANYFAIWGIVPPGAFRPNDIVTYGEVVDTMIKLMDYDNKYTCILDYGALRTAVTKEFIATLGIGGDTGDQAPCTKEQLMVMCSKLLCWAEDYNLRWYAADAKAKDPGKSYEGLFCIVSGTYSIQTALGEEGKHPYLNINTAGQGELRSGTPQNFNITYLQTEGRGRCYTIQTMDGKYLALDGMA
ncbi:MAG: hypothetical protein RR590_04720, partial [Hungatella sp.]